LNFELLHHYGHPKARKSLTKVSEHLGFLDGHKPHHEFLCYLENLKIYFMDGFLKICYLILWEFFELLQV
jgi:hypothetical protein